MLRTTTSRRPLATLFLFFYHLCLSSLSFRVSASCKGRDKNVQTRKKKTYNSILSFSSVSLTLRLSVRRAQRVFLITGSNLIAQDLSRLPIYSLPISNLSVYPRCAYIGIPTTRVSDRTALSIHRPSEAMLDPIALSFVPARTFKQSSLDTILQRLGMHATLYHNGHAKFLTLKEPTFRKLDFL